MDINIITQILLANNFDMLINKLKNAPLLALMLSPSFQFHCLTNCATKSFICVRDKPKLQKGSQSISKTNEPNHSSSEEMKNNASKSSRKLVHFKTYKQLKELSREQDPGISKSEIYEKLLRPFQHEKRAEKNPDTGKFRIIYVCKYGDCSKEYTKIWNLLDHVRMHEGIRPYKCSKCSKTFTQKGNLKKHAKQHELKTLKDRKRSQCKVCKKKYTERYNLMAHMKSHTKSQAEENSKGNN